jgi:uncharacterized membrane protein YoaK (UPF0700 family)
MTGLAMPSANSWFGIRLLPSVLSLTAGSMDVIGYLGFGGLFTAHITGNLVIVAAHVVTGEVAQWAAILSVPVFMLVLCLARLFGVIAMSSQPSFPALLRTSMSSAFLGNSFKSTFWYCH